MSRPKSDTKTRILSETMRLMEQNRGQGVRISDVADAAGISRQAVYLHFSNRTELLVATVRFADEIHGVEARLQLFIKATTGIEMLRGYIDFWGNYVPLIYGLARALLASRAVDEAASAAWEDRMDVLRTGCRSVIECLIRDGVLRTGLDADQATDLLWSLLGIGIWENLTIDRGWSKDQYIRGIQEIAVRTFVKETP